MDKVQDLDFNSQVIWDSNKPLFDIYFKQKFFDNRFRYTFYTIPEDISFDDALDLLKYV
jgi:hypothetical protein